MDNTPMVKSASKRGAACLEPRKPSIPTAAASPPSFPMPDDGRENFEAFTAAYEWLHQVGRRIRRFGTKFRPEGRLPESNWVSRKPRHHRSDLKRMY